MPELLRLAAENTSAELFLIPCADWYVEMLMRAKGALSDLYALHVPRFDVWRMLSDKCELYKTLTGEGISCPEYVAFWGIGEVTDSALMKIPYPAVIKPADSSEYWRNPFPNMRKVYFPKSVTEAKEIIYTIFASGYSESVILQRRVGSVSQNKVLTTVSDKEGRVVHAVMGDVILEQTGKTSYGNHAAIITVPLEEVAFKLIDLLNKISYTGIANFDIMCDGKERYVLDANTRQGRSCDYMRAAGVSLAEMLVKINDREHLTPDFFYKEIYWHYPENKVVLDLADRSDRARAVRLINEKKEATPYKNSYEGVARRAYVGLHNIRLSRSIRASVSGGEDV